MKTGNTSSAPVAMVPSVEPQWSPVMKTGNTGEENPIRGTRGHASMEPGHEDREYLLRSVKRLDLVRPQWSPVMKTGNTSKFLKPLRTTVCLNGARS